MADKNKDQKKNNGQSQGQALVSAISAAVEKGVGKGLEAVLAQQEKTNEKLFTALESISASQEELVKGLHELAIGSVDADVDDDTVDVDAGADATMAGKGKGDATDATDSTGDATDATGDATDVDATVAAAEGTDDLDPTNVDSTSQDDTGSGSNPGDLNPKASPHAKRNARSGAGKQSPGGKSIDKGIAASRGEKVSTITAAAKVIRSLRAEIEGQREDNQKLRNRVKAMEASMERYAERVERKSITPEISALLEKGGWDVRELMASKQRLSVNDVDIMLSQSGVTLEPAMRAAFKNQLLQAGLMDQGQVNRYQ